jgi:hypothetical protein
MAKRKRRMASAWSKEDVNNLRALANAKLSAAQAAIKLRRTRGRSRAEGNEAQDSLSVDQEKAALGRPIEATSPHEHRPQFVV